MAFCVITALQTIRKIVEKMFSLERASYIYRMNIFFQSLTKNNEMAAQMFVYGKRCQVPSSSDVAILCVFAEKPTGDDGLSTLFLPSFGTR